MSHFEFESTLGISASNGAMLIKSPTGSLQIIRELTLSKLLEVYPKWQLLVRQLSAELPSLYLNQPKLRQSLDDLMEDFGLNSRDLTFNQIEALLFYWEKEPALLWQFHNVFPRTLDLPTDEEMVEDAEFIQLDIFETALLYLAQEGKEQLMHEWPLSRIMKIFLSKSFISWLGNPDNKQKILERQHLKYVEDNPIDTDKLAEKIREMMS